MVDMREVTAAVDAEIKKRVNAKLLKEWVGFRNGLLGLFGSEEVLLRFSRLYAQKHDVKATFEELFREKYTEEILQIVMDKINSITGEGT